MFNDDSIGYKVLTQVFPSPYFTTSEAARKTGQRRGDDPAYRPFITFRLNDNAILALDWPETLVENDPLVDVARDLFNRAVSPLISELLDRWPPPLAKVVGLAPLSSTVSQLAPNAEGAVDSASVGPTVAHGRGDNSVAGAEAPKAAAVETAPAPAAATSQTPVTPNTAGEQSTTGAKVPDGKASP